MERPSPSSTIQCRPPGRIDRTSAFVCTGTSNLSCVAAAGNRRSDGEWERAEWTREMACPAAPRDAFRCGGQGRRTGEPTCARWLAPRSSDEMTNPGARELSRCGQAGRSGANDDCLVIVRYDAPRKALQRFQILDQRAPVFVGLDAVPHVVSAVAAPVARTC